MESNNPSSAPEYIRKNDETLPPLPDLDEVFGYSATDLDYECEYIMQSDTQSLEDDQAVPEPMKETSQDHSMDATHPPLADSRTQGHWQALSNQSNLRGPGRHRGLTDLSEKLAHHYSFFRDAVHSKTATKPSHSLAVILSAPKPYASDFAKHKSFQLREHVVFRQARKYIDPVRYFGPLPALGLRGTALEDATTGCTDKYYTDIGTTNETINSSTWWMADKSWNEEDDPVYQDLGNPDTYDSGESMPLNGWFKVSDIPTADEYQEEAWQQCEANWKVSQALQSHKRATGLNQRSRLANDATKDILGDAEERPIVGPVIKGSRTGLRDRSRQLFRDLFRELVFVRMDQRADRIRYFQWAVEATLYHNRAEQSEAEEEVSEDEVFEEGISEDEVSEEEVCPEVSVGEIERPASRHGEYSENQVEGNQTNPSTPSHECYSGTESQGSSTETSDSPEMLSTLESPEPFENEHINAVADPISPLSTLGDASSIRSWPSRHPLADDDDSPPATPELDYCSSDDSESECEDVAEDSQRSTSSPEFMTTSTDPPDLEGGADKMFEKPAVLEDDRCPVRASYNSSGSQVLSEEVSTRDKSSNEPLSLSSTSQDQHWPSETSESEGKIKNAGVFDYLIPKQRLPLQPSLRNLKVPSPTQVLFNLPSAYPNPPHLIPEPVYAPSNATEVAPSSRNLQQQERLRQEQRKAQQGSWLCFGGAVGSLLWSGLTVFAPSVDWFLTKF